ncbi:hypothetical protein CHARACLAT_009933 [Characodon lateralis]|uniref:Uncharacterized protein n=1 Tax=Characodon lateralis TaxID=208331 RepID=A0ABU7EBS1_9TELE|nr:hypothetical protein [Characodon lateralis]
MFALIELYSDRRNKRKMDEVSEPLFVSAFNNTTASCLILLNQSVCLPQGSFTSHSLSFTLFPNWRDNQLFFFFLEVCQRLAAFSSGPGLLYFLMVPYLVLKPGWTGRKNTLKGRS